MPLQVPESIFDSEITILMYIWRINQFPKRYFFEHRTRTNFRFQTFYLCPFTIFKKKQCTIFSFRLLFFFVPTFKNGEKLCLLLGVKFFYSGCLWKYFWLDWFGWILFRSIFVPFKIICGLEHIEILFFYLWSFFVKLWRCKLMLI